MKNKELKIGLALGSGGFRGLAHIGVLKVLEENGIKISYLSGSSIGGLVAAYYAFLKDAKQLEKEGIDAEVVDPRTLTPLDKQAIIKSVKKTGRLVIVSEDCKTAGVSAEIAAMVTEEAIDYLDAPIKRVAEPDTPIPFSPPLEQYVIPDEKAIMKAVKKVV